MKTHARSIASGIFPPTDANFGLSPCLSALNHHLDAALIERLPSLVEMTSLGEGGADLAQAHAFAGFGACPVKPLGQRHRAWPSLRMALAPFAF